MKTLKIGALADSGDLYPFIPLLEKKVKSDDFNLEFEFIPTVQEVNDKIREKRMLTYLSHQLHFIHIYRMIISSCQVLLHLL
jgi:Predicted periplasmic solute-binding protein